MGLTVGHIIYIPVTLLIGAVIGWLLCARVHRVDEIERTDRDAARAKRQAERGARMAKRRAAQEAPADD